MRVRSQTFAKKNDSNAYFSEFLGANGRKIYLDHEIGVQLGVKRLFTPEFVIFICLLVRLNLTFGRRKKTQRLKNIEKSSCVHLQEYVQGFL